MKISNKTKDLAFIIGFLFVVFWVLLGATVWVVSLFAEEVKNDNSAINKMYAEETIVLEMQYQKMWEYTENMTEKEYADTFLSKPDRE